ncbi:MAG: hydrogenase [Pseudomonadota bacterium]|nr:hydrogenase [Pseudomonadota bacterium]
MTTDTLMLQMPAPHTVPATPPLMQRLVAEFGAAWVRDTPDQPFLAAQGDCVLFIAGDPVRFPECLDVAVVLPELHRAFERSFRIAIAERDCEDALARRYAATRRPALVFLRGGQYVATVSGMLDWDDYLREVARVLLLPVSRVPGIGIPLVAAASGAACH